MKTSTKILVFLIAIAVISGSMVGMYFLGNINGKVEVRNELTINETAVYETAKLAAYEAVGTTTFKYTNKVSEEGGFFAQFKNIGQNFLFERTVTITGSYIASYGVVLDTNSSYTQPDVAKGEIHIILPEPKLLFYQTPNDSSQRKIVEDNGAFVLERNSVIEEMESKWYMQGKSVAEHDTAKINAAKDHIAEIFENLYGKTLGKKVFVTFQRDFKGYQKILLQN